MTTSRSRGGQISGQEQSEAKLKYERRVALLGQGKGSRPLQERRVQRRVSLQSDLPTK